MGKEAEEAIWTKALGRELQRSATGEGMCVSVQWVGVGEMESVYKSKAKEGRANQTWPWKLSEPHWELSVELWHQNCTYKVLSGRILPYGFEIGWKEMRAWTKAVAIEMEKKEEVWDGQEAGSTALKHTERGLEGGVVSDGSG